MLLKMLCFLQFSCPNLQKSKKNNNQLHKSEEQTKVTGIDKSTFSSCVPQESSLEYSGKFQGEHALGANL